MEPLKKFLEENMENDIVIHTKNKTDIENFVETIESFYPLKYEILPVISKKSVREYVKEMVLKDGTDGCWRICDGFITYNPSIEHWRDYSIYIIEIHNNDIVLKLGYSSQIEALFEAEKIIKQCGLKNVCKKYGIDAKDEASARILLCVYLLKKYEGKKST